jgi:benzoyl-CoA reductase/2-hydroxyglutaryl-CoA dehydratase subunit BcrC/BadD/HgdB
MREYSEILGEFRDISQNPGAQFNKLLASGRKIVGCLPYFCPEELIYASGMTPFGLWGADMEVSESKRWFPAFICSILHTALELGIRGDYKGMTAVIVPKLCDSLKCMGANWEYAIPDIPVINLTHAQNRKMEAGIEFTASQYRDIIGELARLGGKAASDKDVSDAAELLKKRRASLRVFTQLAAEHPEIITPRRRNDVIKSSYFMEAGPFISMLSELNGAIKGLPDSIWNGPRIVTTGIIADSTELLDILEENNIMIAGDQVLHESVSFRDNGVVMEDPVLGLAHRMSSMGGTSVLYDPGKQRAKELVKLVEKASADGVIFILTKFCDPEEYDYVPVKKLLDENGIPCLLIEVDRQMAGYEQIRSAVETFAGMLNK